MMFRTLNSRVSVEVVAVTQKPKRRVSLTQPAEKQRYYFFPFLALAALCADACGGLRRCERSCP